ncbi:MAG: site-specific DNA-methyltransferase [Bacteroidales bacterium]|nr:site-specific DNA-methyltransferase [Bacteroidales bacterium]
MNIPPVGMAQYDTAEEPMKKYEYDPHLDPSLQWAGKAERTSFEIPTSSIHIHESIKPLKIISSLLNKYRSTEYAQGQTTLWHQESPAERMKRRRETIQFYQHGVDWTNRMIAGDSLVIMNSLLEKEGMSGQVQMVYFDPPYGIKYGSNFQPFVDKRDVKDGKDEDLSQEPEMIKAFRDTWELGIHSYLSYLRDRLLLARELLSESGSVFVQISDENVHHVREIMDEVFGKENFVSMITFSKTTSQTSNTLATTSDYLLFYAKNISSLKYRQLYQKKDIYTDKAGVYTKVELPDGTRRPLTNEEKANPAILPFGSRIFRKSDMTSQSGGDKSSYPVEHLGKTYTPGKGHWKTNPEGMQRLIAANRIEPAGISLGYIRYIDDFPVYSITNLWTDTGTGSFTDDKVYVVQTGTKTIQRCMLMTTDPGDLVLDITCGSGTTAYVAEKYGRRWITCDTSRVALALAKQRLMTATFDYYKLAHPEQGVGSGFVYKTVPHVTLKSIAQNEPLATETLYDQPEIDKDKIRISGPFTMEALPAPVVKPIEDIGYQVTAGKKQEDWIDQLEASGILGRGGNRIQFSRIEPLAGTQFLHAEGETKEDTPQRAVICFGSETRPLDSRMVSLALNEAEEMRPAPKLIIFAAFQFDPEATKDIDETKWPGVTLLKVQMNADLMTEDLKKKERSAQSFFLIGQPDVELIELENNRYQIKVHGFDYYNVKTGIVESGDTSRIAMWMLDTNYDGMSIEPEQIFFPISGKTGGWSKLAKTLRAEINQELIEAYSGTESLPFEVKENTQIAVKIIDDRGVESLKTIRIGV